MVTSTSTAVDISEAHPGSEPQTFDNSLLFQQTLPAPRPASSSRSPRRITTDPLGDVKTETFKRIIVCCDGTWQDGIAQPRSMHTNVLRLARSVVLEDERLQPSITQIVFYQPGIGSPENFYARFVEGTTGSSLGDKVEQAYAFIAHNYKPGDEIFLFGFSRGAYTARMVAQFIGEIGVLDRKDMDSFAHIFLDYQMLGKTKDPAEKKIIEDKLAPWRSPEAHGKTRACTNGQKFTIKFLGIWDTVGALGLPGPFREEHRIFDFNDSLLGDHIECACQALALNEMRADFNCNKMQQTDAGRAKHQVVKQVWFAGCHSDIGGGYELHDLADLALIWMADEVSRFLSLDLDYFRTLVKPVAPWGKQCPHDSIRGIFLFAWEVKRTLPSTSNDPTTHEFIHESVLEQLDCNPDVQTLIERYPDLVCPLGNLEKAIRENWPYDENDGRVQNYGRDVRGQLPPTSRWLKMFMNLTRSRDLNVRITESTATTLVIDQTAVMTTDESTLSPELYM